MGIYISDGRSIVLKHFLARVRFDTNEEGSDIAGLTVTFLSKGQDHICYTSKILPDGKKEPARRFRNTITLRFRKYQALHFMATLIEGVSGYLHSVREKIHGGKSYIYTMHIHPILPGDKGMKLRLTVSRNYRRSDAKVWDEEAGRMTENKAARHRIYLSIFDNEGEIVEIPLTRRDILLMLENIRSAFRATGIQKIHFATVPTVAMTSSREEMLEAGINIPVTIDHETVGFSNIFLHKQEILNLYQLVRRLAIEPSVQDNLDDCLFGYRQLKARREGNFVFLELQKMKVAVRESLDGREKIFFHEVLPSEEGGVNFTVFLSNTLLAGLYLAISPGMVVRSSLEDVDDNAMVARQKKKEPVLKILTREGILGFAKGKSTFRENKEGEKIYNFFVLRGIATRYVDEEGSQVYRMANGEKPNTIKHYLEDGTSIDVPILEEFSIPLYNQWIPFLGILSVAYAKKFAQNLQIDNFLKDDINHRTIEIFSSDHIGSCRYLIKVHSDAANIGTGHSQVEYPAVLIVEKYRSEKGEEKGEYRQKIEAKFRMPLQRRYLHELLTIGVEFGRYIDDYRYIEKLKRREVLPVLMHDGDFIIEDDEAIAYGVERRGGGTVTGLLESRHEFTEIGEADRVALLASALYRIFYGKWLPFNGMRCSVSDDGYYCDMKTERAIEVGSYGPLFAWEYAYGAV